MKVAAYQDFTRYSIRHESTNVLAEAAAQVKVLLIARFESPDYFRDAEVVKKDKRRLFVSTVAMTWGKEPPTTEDIIGLSFWQRDNRRYAQYRTEAYGWFREISDMWPGQAMTLKVNQVVHHEKSKYQDVLIFESTDYGMVLVLDNVIQCTERDEFSYQEMITHLAMNSHPNPKKVLVIGGGDGGVLREVVKHECVEEAVLCDIDEAVIRLSKKYLPGMAVGYQHPNVKTHVGDGFKFLDDKKGEFDVIITDSSDPEGPAEALFQKPYFELLKGALREGGVITTQGSENQWLHLPLITKLKQDCKQVFPNVEYGYTTIPTYPSGQIGFMVCCLDANRDLKKPLRQWSEAEEDKLCKYYNKEIHEAAFVLPNFAKKALK
ncbi:spermidine synthase [Aureobasidium subglaciale]|nr:spermidine synthase [Aureobasidium subglaciale]KAI5231102.1 spermidine synthase [Aureobasidium subglaciale]KAI5234229.1 spermidine synthase [Aureobasidium subglaciale]KAI5267540.1 spermidine synthase [Aureobasidium subglaciale]